MASVTIKNIPDELLKAVRAISEAENRSLNRQLIQLLDEAIATRGFGERASPDLGLLVREQVAAWRALAGDWADELEIERRKGAGRKVDL